MITKSELIEYLKNTPENTNYNILYSSLYNGSNKEAVDEFIEVLSHGNLSLAALQPYLAKLYEDDKTISPDPLPPFSSGGSVSKPLTYDYMPEGYPSKTIETVTLMEEQALEFADMGGSGPYAASLTNAFEIAVGQTYTVNWDGAEYECVGATAVKNVYVLGNMSIAGEGADTGQPFIYVYATAGPEAVGQFGTLDTSASHTISVKGIVETVTPMAEKFLPETLATKLDVEVAQTAANAAQNTADNAQTAADNAQTAANGAAKKVDPVFTGTFSQNRKENTVIGSYSHAEGYNTTASGDYSHAEGKDTTVSGDWSHAEGSCTKASGSTSHAEGNGSTASGGSSHAEGDRTIASGNYSHAEGLSTTASDYYSHAEGYITIASGLSSHAEGYNTTAKGSSSHAEGRSTTAKGYSSHAEGENTTASGSSSHAEGYSTNVIPDTITSSSSNSEIIAAWKTAKFSLAKDKASHVEGYDNLALEEASHAEGSYTIASGYCSHAEGKDTKASGNFSHVQGKYNIEDLANTYAHIVGNGSNDNSRSNAHTIDWSGNAWFAGTVEGTALIIPSSTEGSTKKFKITVDDSGAISATEII